MTAPLLVRVSGVSIASEARSAAEGTQAATSEVENECFAVGQADVRSVPGIYLNFAKYRSDDLRSVLAVEGRGDAVARQDGLQLRGIVHARGARCEQSTRPEYAVTLGNGPNGVFEVVEHVQHCRTTEYV